MKKTIVVFICIVVSLLLSACGAPKQVPEQTIVWTVEDYLKECGYGTASEYTYEAIHTVDNETKTDTVDIALSAVFPTASIMTSCQVTYQYNKSSDLWSEIRGGGWAPASVTSYSLDVSPQNILTIIQEKDVSAKLNKDSGIPDLLPVELAEKTSDSWEIVEDVSAFMSCKVADPSTAYDIFLLFCYDIANGNAGNKDLQEAERAIGDNYHYVKLLNDYLECDLYMICQNDTLLFFGSSDGKTLEKLMHEIGFIPDMACEPFDVVADAKDMLYRLGETYLKSGYYDYAINLFTDLDDFRDSAVRKEEAIEAKNADAYAAAEELLNQKKYDDAIAAFSALGSYSNSPERIEEAGEAKNADAYAAAEELLKQKKYDDAIAAFSALGSYSNSPDRLEEVIEEKNETIYLSAEASLLNGDYLQAIQDFESLKDFKDSTDRVNESIYLYASHLADEGQYSDAAEMFSKIPTYKDSLLLMKKARYDEAIDYSTKGDLNTAIEILTTLDDYEDSKQKIEEFKNELDYQAALSMLSYGREADCDDIEEARSILLGLGDYKDTKDILDHILYVIVKSTGYGDTMRYYYGASGPEEDVIHPKKPSPPYDTPEPLNDDTTSYEMEGNNKIVTETTDSGVTYIGTYDDQNRLISVVSDQGDNMEYKYDQEGRLIKCSFTTVKKRTITRGDKVLYPTNTYTEGMTVTYNSQGLITFLEETYHEVRQDENGVINYNASFFKNGTYTYNDKGLMVKSDIRNKWHRPDVQTITTTYQYDDQNRLLYSVENDNMINGTLYLNYTYEDDKVVCVRNHLSSSQTKYYYYGYIWAPEYEGSTVLE